MLLAKAGMVAATWALISTGAANAAYLYPWDDANPSVVDPDDPIADAQDILAAWHAQDANSHYFRIDLQGAPAMDPANGADIYGIYIDTGPGGGPNTSIGYIPSELTTVNHVLDAHLDDGGVFFDHHYHTWSAYIGWAFQNATEVGGHQESENGGTTLEWKIDVDAFGPVSFTWWAANLDYGDPDPTTNDITEGVYVPEPSTPLMVMMVAGLAVRRRRH